MTGRTNAGEAERNGLAPALHAGWPRMKLEGMAPRRTFVGRKRELEEIGGAIDDALDGRGALFLLVGSAGIGKTRLADELCRYAQSRGVQSFWGRCWETGGAPAYWPWIQILREVTHHRPGEELRAAAGAGAAAIGQLVPELGVNGPSPPPEPEPSQARFRLFDAVTGVLKAAARVQPLMLVLDDLHTADPSSLALLHFVARNLHGLRALVIGTYRDEEARLDDALGQLLGEIAREGTYLPLAPLTRQEIAAVVAAFSGASTDERLLESLERATEGNPLFLDELLRLLLQRGELGPRATASPPGGAAFAPLLPDTIRDVIRRRVSRLPPETRELLAAASVIGRELAPAGLARLVGTSVEDVVAGLEPAVAAGLLAPTDPAIYRFSHVLVREALYRDLPAPRRQELHLALARALEARGEEVATEIAHHHLAALPAGDEAAAVAAARRAAERAMAMLAFEDAASLLVAARARLEAVGRLDPEHGFELQLTAGLAFIRAGQGDKGRALCASAAEAARRLGDSARLAEAALAYGAELMLAQNDATLIGLLQESLELLPVAATGMRAQVMARLAAAQMPADDISGPMAMAREAIAIARAECPDPDTLRRVLYFAGSALADYGDPSERAAVNEEMVTLARAAGDKVQMLRGYCRLVFDYLDLADWERSQRTSEAYAALANEFRQPRHLWPVSMMRAMYATSQGKADEARQALADARRLAEGDRDVTTAGVLAWHRIHQVVVFEWEDEADAALAEVAKAVCLPHYEKPVAQTLIDVSRAMLLGRFSDDSEEVSRSVDVLPWNSPLLTVDGGVVAGLAEAMAVAGDIPRARSSWAALAPYERRVGSSGRSGFICFGPMDGLIGILAGTAGAVTESIDRLEHAISIADRLAMRPYAAHARYWQAKFLAVRQTPGDGERARERLEQAAAGGEALGLRRLAARIAHLRATIDGRPRAGPAPIAGTAPSGASEDERHRSPGSAGGDTTLTRAGRIDLTREGDFWTVSAGDGTARIRDSRGMKMLAELIANPGRELHVLALIGSDLASEEVTVDGGDAGEVLDGHAIAQYRSRLSAIDEELAEAQAWSDAGRAARARAERDAIAEELARGVGLGGRSRRAGAAAERARVNVQRRIRGAIRKIGESLPAVGAYLDRAVRTGTFCSYDPF